MFTRKDHVQRHYLEQHMKPKEYQCQKCQKKFKRRYLMENHNRNCNGLNLMYLPCLSCGLTFKSKEKLIEHIHKLHTIVFE
nr:unnamed protein product [Callosobruchus analis]